METAFFWIAWGVISLWALKTFYFSFSKDKFEKLRKANIGFTIALVLLYFLPWVPLSLDGWTGFGLAFEGNFLAILFFILLLHSLVLFLQKEYIFLKLASILTILLTFNLFVLMLFVRPGTYILSLYDIAPIVAFLILLCENVAVLLLWQQMQLAPKATVVPGNRKKIIVGISSLFIIVLGSSIFFSGGYSKNVESVVEQEVVSESLGNKEFEAFSKNEPGLVCSGDNHFSFQIDSPYIILSDDDKGIAIFIKNRLLTVTESDKDIKDFFEDFEITGTKEGEIYFYEVTANKSAETSESKKYGMSKEKNGFIISVFSSGAEDKESVDILSSLAESLKDGCGENE